MKIKTQKAAIMKVAQGIQNIASIKSALPILSNILIETHKGSGRLIATDLDIGMIASFQANIIEDGATTVPAKKFYDIIKDLPEGQDITITVKKNNNITIESGSCYFKLLGLPREEFPKLPEFQNVEVLIIPQATLKSALMMTAFAMSHDQTRYILNGTLFIISGKGIRAVTTDGRRLALIDKEVNVPSGYNKKVIIPAKAVNELIKILKDEGDLKLMITDNQASFDMGESVIITRLIEGEFPNYEQVIPKEHPDKVKVNKDAFLMAAHRVSLFTSQDSQAIKLDIFKDKVVVSKSSPDVGEAREEFDATYGGKELTVGFNPMYLIDVLKNVKEQEVNFEVTSPDKPGVIRTKDKYVYLVLPMQLV